MQLPKESDCKKILIYTATAILIGGAIIGAFHIAFSLLLPFTLAFLTAILLQPVVRLLHRRTNWSQHRLSTLLLCLAWLCAIVLLFLFLRFLLSQLCALPSFLQAGAPTFLVRLSERYLALRNRFPFAPVSDLERDPLWQFLSRSVSSFLQEIGESGLHLLRRLVARLPNSIFSFVTFVVATFSFSANLSRIQTAVLQRLPSAWRQKVSSAKSALRVYAFSYLRAYGILLVFTFAQLFFALSLLRIPYAAAIAALISVLDLFPVLGVGTVLLPWSAFLLLFGDYKTGLALLFLWLVVMVVRQIIEPRIIGAQMGVHPLLTLFATYLGYRLFGFFGLLLMPILLPAFSRFLKKAWQKLLDRGLAFDCSQQKMCCSLISFANP